jgi:hypothetical protein
VIGLYEYQTEAKNKNQPEANNKVQTEEKNKVQTEGCDSRVSIMYKSGEICLYLWTVVSVRLQKSSLKCRSTTKQPSQHHQKVTCSHNDIYNVSVRVFNATFNNISVISSQSDLLEEDC